MTVETRDTEAKVTYTVTEVERDMSFEIDFKFLKNDEMLKAVLRKQDGTTLDLVLDTDYYIEYTGGNNNIWGKLVMMKDYEGLKNICVYRDIPTSQDRIFSSQTIFSSVIEASLDKLTMIMQDIQSFLARALHAPIDDVISPDTMELPPASDGEGYLIRDKDGKYKVTDASGQSKALRQAKGEISDPTFELSLNERAGKYITFDDEGSVVLKDPPEGGVQSDWDEVSELSPAYIKNKPAIINTLDSTSTTDILSANMGKNLNDTKQNKLTAGDNITIVNDVISATDGGSGVQSDWNEEDSTDPSYIKNKPDLVDIKPILSWLSYSIPDNLDWRGLAFGKGVFVTVACNSNKIMYTSNGKVWTEATNLPATAKWRDVIFGNGVFIAIAQEYNKVAISTDGITWTLSSALPATDIWMGIAYGNGKFVITSQGNKTLVSSDNGNSWTLSTSIPSRNWRSVTYGNGVFVAIANNSNKVAHSSDGITWTETNMPASKAWYVIYFAKGKFIALADGSTEGAISTDGINWTAITLPAGRFLSLTYGGGLFVAMPYGGDQVAVSRDGTNWNLVDMIVDAQVQAVAFGNNVFVAICHDSLSSIAATFEHIEIIDSLQFTFKDKALSANMGKTLNDTKQNTLTAGDNITIVNDVISATGGGSGAQSDWNEEDSTDPSYIKNKPFLLKPKCVWIDKELPSSQDWRDICSGTITIDSIQVVAFVAIAYNYNMVAISPDGQVWDEASLPQTRNWCGIAYGNGQFVAIAENSDSIAYSSADDTTTWTEGTLPTSEQWRCITFGKGHFVAISGTGKLAVSENGGPGTTWTSYEMPTAGNWRSICFANDKFVAVLENSDKAAYCETYGLEWTEVNLPAVRAWSKVCGGNGVFVAIADQSFECAISTDGINWRLEPLPTLDYGYYSAVTYGFGKFVAIAHGNSCVAVSEDGVHWKLEDLWDINDYSAIAFRDDRFVAVAQNTNISTIGYFCITEIIDDLEDDASDKPLSAHMGMELDETKQNKLIAGDGILIDENDTISTVPTVCFEEVSLPTVLCTFNKVAYGNGRFVALGSGTVPSQVIYSDDGIHWLPGNLTVDNWACYALTYGYGKFVALGSNSNVVAYSIDGVSWTTASNLPEAKNWCDIAYGESRFLAIADDYRNGIMSTDGVNWSQFFVISEGIHPQKIAYGNGQFVITTDNRTVITVADWSNRTDGSNYTAEHPDALPFGGDEHAICFGDGKFVALARGIETHEEYHQAAVSIDGVNWSLVDLLPDLDRNWEAIAYGAGVFIAITCGNGKGAVSKDGTHWKPFSMSRKGWHAITYGAAGRFAMMHNMSGGPAGLCSVI